MVLTGLAGTASTASFPLQATSKTANGKPIKNTDGIRGRPKPNALEFTIRFIMNSSFPLDALSAAQHPAGFQGTFPGFPSIVSC
jgi:hypothetical protein